MQNPVISPVSADMRVSAEIKFFTQVVKGYDYLYDKDL